MKRKGFAVLFAAVMAAGLCACGGSSSGDENSAGTPEVKEEKENESDTDAGEKKVITLWETLAESEQALYQTYVDEFNAQSDTVEVKLVYMPPENFNTQVAVGNLSSEMGDILRVDNPETVGYAASGVLADLTDYYNNWDEANYLEGPIASATYEDKIYGIPAESNCIALYYNKEMLKEAGVEVPTTWTELKAAAKALTTEEHFGFAMSAQASEEGTFHYLPFLWSVERDVTKLGSEAGIEALTYLNSIFEDGSMSLDCLNYTQADAAKQFAAGNFAMMINGPWNVSVVQQDNPELDFGIALIPKAEDGENASCLGGENLCVSANADVDACWEFISWFCSKEVNARYVKDMGKFSPRSDMDLDEMYADDEIMMAFAEEMEYAYPRSNLSWNEISKQIQTMMQETYTGSKTPEQAAKDAQAAVEKIIEEQ